MSDAREPQYKNGHACTAARAKVWLDAHTDLMQEMFEALLGNPSARVSVPMWVRPGGHVPAHEVVQDLLAGTDGTAHWIELLSIVGDIASGVAATTLQPRAVAWVAWATRQYADDQVDGVVE